MKVAVIGGGIAGCSAAYALAQRGVEVTLVEKNEIASGASGNALGIFHPRIEKHWSPITRFYLSAFGYARRQLAELGGKGMWWDSPGMLQFPKRRDPQKSVARLEALPKELQLTEEVARFVETDEANALAGVSSSFGALYFPNGTWVRPREWCARLAENISFIEKQVVSLTRQGGWRILLSDGEPLEADVVIVAAANDTSIYPALSFLPVCAVRGQITEVPATKMSESVRSILCYDGYVSPLLGGMHWCGSTYDYEKNNLMPDSEGNQHNLAMLERLWPSLFAGVEIETLKARAAFRAVTPDRLPLIGAWEEGLYLSLGHGSRGLLSAPLGGELIASMVAGDPLPCDADVMAALNPRRFGVG